MSLYHQQGITAQWHELVSEAQTACGVQLNTPLESYLVHTLIQYTQRPEIAARIFAIDYMLAQHEQGQVRNAQLRELADQCLLYAGLFPQHAKRRNVRVSYYVDIGRSAYFELGNVVSEWSAIFSEISENFISLMDTLLAIHHIDRDDDEYILDHESALQTWQDTQSKQALKILQQQIRSDNIVDFGQAATKKYKKH